MKRPVLEVREIEAAVTEGPGRRLSIKKVLLEGPRNDEVLVRLVASGICHTDISFIEGGSGTTEPAILGHEGAGIVESVGNGVEGFDPGDHVVLSYQSCGRCEECRKGHPAGCRLLWELNFNFARLDGTSAYGHSHVAGHFFGQSSFATHTVVTARNTVKVPQEISLVSLAPLGCGIQTGAGTVFNTLHVSDGEGIVILGTGAVGLAAVMAARVVGAHPIVAVDINPSRLALASELGATHTIHSPVRDCAPHFRSEAIPSVKYVADTTGDHEAIRTATKFLKDGGVIALLAGNVGPGLLSGGRRVISVIQGDAVPQQFIPFLIRLHQDSYFPFDRLFAFYGFSDINKAIKDSIEGRVVKPVVTMARG
jgi:aryl-alcohol dehydrogenase